MMKRIVTIMIILVLAFGISGCATSKDNAVEITEGGETPVPEETPSIKTLTQEQALSAIKNYCYNNNPDLKDMEESDEYTIYWDVSTNDENEIVVLYRSYTGAETRYYINPASGETYVTELVPGIIDEEERTEEVLNAWDYYKTAE